MAWAVDKPGVVLLLVCQLLTGFAAAVVLAFTAQAMTHNLATGTVPERLQTALPALAVVTTAAGLAGLSALVGALSIALVRELIPVWRRYLRMSLQSGRLGSPAWRCDLFR
ncbi:hypothetical protein [Streptomyces acidicola]|uniref:Uncharacterized protein n=1 Tax=Streptomyces acidicola TaxID=2596892 RepID=A0A5N8WKK3_9ACTN|nr:hypothetical protein [Streptomyces acidicola]MPY47366.1 hypothetical protein [Streptomyces acidicola]